MARVKDIDVSGYCDALNRDLLDMKARIESLRTDSLNTYGAESPVYITHERHLTELADIIEWKIQILMKACPFEWKGMDTGVESTVSVGPAGKTPMELSGGYVGG